MDRAPALPGAEGALEDAGGAAGGLLGVGVGILPVGQEGAAVWCHGHAEVGVEVEDATHGDGAAGEAVDPAQDLPLDIVQGRRGHSAMRSS